MCDAYDHPDVRLCSYSETSLIRPVEIPDIEVSVNMTFTGLDCGMSGLPCVWISKISFNTCIDFSCCVQSMLKTYNRYGAALMLIHQVTSLEKVICA